MVAKVLWIGAAIAWAGMFAPWEVFQGLFDNTGVSGFGVAGFDQVRNGFGMNLLVNKPYLFLVPVCTALAALLATRPVARPEFRWIVLALSLAALAACVAFFPNFAQDKNQVLAVVSISWGSGVSIVGCIGALAGAAWALLSSRDAATLRPAYAATTPAVPLYTFAPSNSSALAATPASNGAHEGMVIASPVPVTHDSASAASAVTHNGRAGDQSESAGVPPVPTVAPNTGEMVTLPGSVVQPVAAPTRDGANAARPVARYCVHCGGALRPDDRFCRSCGAALA